MRHRMLGNGGCDKFVISGTDVLYWRRKREQWRSIVERAPDDKTADCLHEVFDRTSVNVPEKLWSPEEIHDGSATVDVALFRNGVAVADLSATGTRCAVCVDPLGGFVRC